MTAFGEPSKKGGGLGPVPVYMEWNQVELVYSIEYEDEERQGVKGNTSERGRDTFILGVMVELREPGIGELTSEQISKGVGGVWDRAADWEWYCLKLFRLD